MYKGDAKHMAIIDQWVDFVYHHIGKWIGVCFFQIQEVTNFNFSEYPNIVCWYQSIKSFPAYDKFFSNFEGNMIIH